MLDSSKANKFYCLILTLLILLAYANSFQNAFQYDDFHVIIKNPSIKDPSNYYKFFLNPQIGSGIIKETSGYRPLLMASFALNYSLGGLDVFGYHLINFILHTLCALLVFFITLLFLNLTTNEKRLNPTRNQLTALLAALLFALHPIQTESVTYITGRSSLLTAFFFLTAFWAYMQYRLTGEVRRLFLSSFSYACALLVKETALTLLITLILFNLFFPLARTWKRRLFSLFPYFILSAIYLMIRLHFFGFLQYGTKPIRPFYDNLLTQFRAWVHYLGTLLLPLNLNVDYDFPISHSILEGQVIFSLFILATLVIIIWKISKVSRVVGFFLLWFAINLLPTNSLIPLEDVVTDRWLYLPSVGYAVIVALAAEWIFRAKVRMGSRASKLAFFFLCALVIEFYSFATVLRNFTWTRYWTLWEDAVEKSPNKSRPHVALGLALTKTGHIDEGVQEFRIAIQLNPRAGEAYLNLGHIYHTQGKFEEAIQAFQKAVILSPHLAPEVHNNLGVAYMEQGRKEEGFKELHLALEARPLYGRAYYSLGNFYEKEGDIDKVISCMEKAAKLDPEFVPIHKALTRLYEKKGWKEKSQESHRNYLKYAALGKHFFIGQ
jgi:tetratricopeptide (TPR) repeat protein